MSLHDESNKVCQVSGTDELPPTRLKIIGHWVDDDRPDLPDPANLIDSDWEIGERKTVANYLNAGRLVSTGSGCSPCRICGSPNGFDEFTDGVYQWPEGLAHYVLDHAVRLPDEIVKHALRSTDAAAVGLVDTTWWTTATS